MNTRRRGCSYSGRQFQNGTARMISKSARAQVSKNFSCGIPNER
jgi:hypothetical protein